MIPIWSNLDKIEMDSRICRNCTHFETYTSKVDPIFNFQKCTYYPSPAFGMQVSELSSCEWFHKKEES